MWTARLRRRSRLGIILLIVIVALLLGWLRLNHAMFAVIACSVAGLAGLFAVAWEGFRQTTSRDLVSRGIDPTDDNYSPVSDSNLSREWAPMFSMALVHRLTSKPIRRQVYRPSAKAKPLALPRIKIKRAAKTRTARPAGPVKAWTGQPAGPVKARPVRPAKTSQARPAKSGGRARQRIEMLPVDATVNFGVQRREVDLDDLFAALDRKLIGLDPVKQKVAEIGSLLMVDRARQRFGLTAPRPNLHMCFTGAPGTGKTTVALMMADLLRKLGYLDSGHVVHAMRDDLVGEYIGRTAPMTKRVLDSAMGGVLFIDEAYALCRDDDVRDYGHECVDILMQVMENQRDELVVILAGYKEPMDHFFESNPGMRSRVAHHLDFAPYQTDELLAIGQLMLDQSSYYLSAKAKSAFRDSLSAQRTRSQFAHARSVRNALEGARLNHAYRLATEPARSWTKDDLMRLEPPDVLSTSDWLL
jgi:probable Rubsico expression protein CbbX